jgi:hypothetical protein
VSVNTWGVASVIALLAVLPTGALGWRLAGPRSISEIPALMLMIVAMTCSIVATLRGSHWWPCTLRSRMGGRIRGPSGRTSSSSTLIRKTAHARRRPATLARQKGDSDGTLRWAQRPASWVFAGVRKLVKCDSDPERPDDGTEITYTETFLRSLDAVRDLAAGRRVWLPEYD